MMLVIVPFTILVILAAGFGPTHSDKTERIKLLSRSNVAFLKTGRRWKKYLVRTLSLILLATIILNGFVATAVGYVVFLISLLLLTPILRDTIKAGVKEIYKQRTQAEP